MPGSFQHPGGKREIISLSKVVGVSFYNLENFHKNLRHPLKLSATQHCFLPFVKPLYFFPLDGEGCYEI